MPIAQDPLPASRPTRPPASRSFRQIMAEEAHAILRAASHIPTADLEASMDMILKCEGHVCVTGLGKAGLIGNKIAATLASTGTPSYFLHPSEALHGDLGRLKPRDLIMALSASGETSETVQVARIGVKQGHCVLAVTCSPQSSLAQIATIVLPLQGMRESGALGLAPTSSTTCMLAVGDALALVVSELRGFTAQEFAKLHPAGTLGLKLSSVDDVMRPLKHCRLAPIGQTARKVLVSSSKPGRRSGAIMLVDQAGCLRGIFTDSDLARLIEQRRDDGLDAPIENVMTKDPKHVIAGERLVEAVHVLTEHKLSELPVVNRNLQPVGMLDITDVLTLLPVDPPLEASAAIHRPDGTETRAA
jgi:arabinose-5-phosphate isomerase